MLLLHFFTVGTAYTVEYRQDIADFNAYTESDCKIITTDIYNKTCSYSCYGSYTCTYECLQGIWIVRIDFNMSLNYNYGSLTTYQNITIYTNTDTNSSVVIDQLNQHPIGFINVCWYESDIGQWHKPCMPTSSRDVMIVMWVLFFIGSIVFIICNIVMIICIIL